MKENDSQLLRLILLWIVFPFMEFSVIGEYNIKTLAANFSPLFLLPWYSQVTSIFTFISDYSVELLILKCLLQINTKKLRVRIVVPKLQSLILTLIRRVFPLVHCIVSNVPISPHNPKMI